VTIAVDKCERGGDRSPAHHIPRATKRFTKWSSTDKSISIFRAARSSRCAVRTAAARARLFTLMAGLIPSTAAKSFFGPVFQGGGREDRLRRLPELSRGAVSLAGAPRDNIDYPLKFMKLPKAERALRPVDALPRGSGYAIDLNRYPY